MLHLSSRKMSPSFRNAEMIFVYAHAGVPFYSLNSKVKDSLPRHGGLLELDLRFETS